LPWQKWLSTRIKLFTNKTDFNLRTKLIKYKNWIKAFCGAKTLALLKLAQMDYHHHHHHHHHHWLDSPWCALAFLRSFGY
jgi:hypothetical protein